MIYVFLAEGFEEVEALAPVDILRRAGFEVKTVGVTGKSVSGSHGIKVETDVLPNELDTNNLQAVILPGGMPGTLNLKADETVKEYITYAADNNILIGAICAAPSILGSMGLLNGKKAVCFPGFEKELSGAEIQNLSAVSDGNIVTAKGAGAALDFGFKLLEVLTDKQTAETLSENMCCS